jgi:hypothetical protein
VASLQQGSGAAPPRQLPRAAEALRLLERR